MIDTKVKSIFIDGTWQDTESERTVSVYNPATLEEVAAVANGGEAETEQAIAAASSAFTKWREMTGRERSKVLYKAYQLMEEETDRLANILTSEQGKPVAEAAGEVKGAANFLLWYAEEASRSYGEWIPYANKATRKLVIPQPVGVVGAITP